MAAITPRRTGIVVFGARVVSIFTGLLFIVMVTHSLTAGQFGLLEVINSLVVFASFPLGTINFWVARDTARGKTIGKTAILTNLVLSVVGVMIFALLAVVRQSTLTTSLFLFVAAVFLVPVTYWYSTANSIILAHRTEAAGYVLLIEEVSKLAVAYVLLFVFKAGIIGVVLALAISNLVQGAVATYYIRSTLAGALSFEQWKKWFKDSWLPALNSAPYVIGTADTFVAFLISGTTLTGYYQAAYSVALMVGYCGYLSYALYPLLLRGSSDKVIGVLFDFSMLFGIPMAVGVAALSPQFLFLLSKTYVITAVPLAVLGFSILLGAVNSLLDNSLMGRDTSDLVQENRFRNFLKSNLFFVPMANLVYSVLYILSVALIVYVGSTTALSYLDIITYWAIAQLALTASVVGVKLRRLGLNALQGTRMPLAFYSACALAMGVLVYLVAPFFLAFDMPALNFGLRLAVVVGLGGITYFGLLAAIDRRSRDRLARFAEFLMQRDLPARS